MNGEAAVGGVGVGNAGYATRWERAMIASYATPTVALVRGQGAWVWDADGRRYIDLLAGIAVNVLGHAHPAVVEAVTRQVATLGHTSNLYAHEPGLRLAERLLGLAGRDGRVFFANSGAEANEAALKLSRRTGRQRVVTTEGAFHGRTFGALSLTAQPAKQEPFRPLVPGVVAVPYGDSAALAGELDDRTAAFFVEPVQGEAGVVLPPPGYLSCARELTRGVGSLLVVDEVQTGIGRSGAWFAYQHTEIEPDVVTLAKGLGGGLPIAAMLCFDAAASLLTPGSHGSTFGGNPVAAAAALAVLDTIEADGLLDRARELGARICDGVRRIEHPLVAEVRQAGLLIGVVLTEPSAGALEAVLRRAGFLTNAAAPDVLRLAPPLVLTDADADEFLAALPGALDTVEAAGLGRGTERG